MSTKRDFTDRYLKSLKALPPGKRVILFDAQVPGFGIRISDKSRSENKGVFVLVARYPGSGNPAPRRIGDYPTTSLADARRVAREWLEDLRSGVDPKVKAAERQREEARRRTETFAATFHVFAEEHLSTLRTGDEVKRSVMKHVMPRWGERPITDIRRADVHQLMRDLRKSGPIAANRTLAYVKKFFSWLVDQDMLDASPAASVKRPSKENKRDRVLSETEIKAIWQACGELGTSGRAIRFMLATGQRRNEVGAATWGEIDLRQKVWTLRRERTKADRTHEVPLSPPSLSIIEECLRLSDFVFSTGRRRRAEEGQQSVAAAPSGWSKAKIALDALASQRLAAIAIERGESPAPLAEWHLHDLRRTAATYMAKLGVDRVVIGKVLNHAEGEVTAVYDRHRYDMEKRRALDLWGEHLLEIISGTDLGNVVSLTAVRK
jgi:integrase